MSSIQELTDATLRAIFKHFAKYLFIEREDNIQMSLWVIHTYLLEELRFSPRLIFNASQPASGKSTAQERVSALCYHSQKVGNFSSGASIANFFKAEPRTLHLDEAENYLDPTQNKSMYDALMAILCDGYKLGAVKLTSEKGKDGNWQSNSGNMFGAVSLAGTHTPISSALRTRSLIIQMRKDTEKRAQRFSERFQGGEVEELRANLDHIRERRQEFEDIELDERLHFPSGLDSRRVDMYSPLVQIALVAKGGWFEEIFKIMESEVSSSQAITDSGEHLTRIQRLYRDIYEVLKNREGFISSTELVNQLRSFNPEEWQSYESGAKPLNTQSLASYLHRDGIFQTRQANLRGYHQEAFAKEFKAHSLIPLGSAELAKSAELAETRSE
jgi:hypothetical protein